MGKATVVVPLALTIAAPAAAEEACVAHCYYDNKDHCCNASPFNNDDRLVCGKHHTDWIHPEACKSAPSPGPTPPGPVPRKHCASHSNHCVYDGKDHCCNHSPFNNDDRLVCGPHHTDWIKPDTCVPPAETEAPAATEMSASHGELTAVMV
eukprot:TRINITY_DN574_c0_g1_i3.p1 TRINITY_DN574_c0_g1~~TRINITY_DN574_c0_g1_i3.p1  ORF type:complete len:170 (+),score=20.72 TRINITY_DN574_c0_g1_i3:60-512(+)